MTAVFSGKSAARSIGGRAIAHKGCALNQIRADGGPARRRTERAWGAHRREGAFIARRRQEFQP
jgi:hypothetical protein